MNTNSDHKSTIAKLLATENIHVVHKKTQTASFNVATRELILPIFKDSISNDLYDLFVCHEVAHALWTPLNMLDKIREQGIDKSVVNVIEDARIEAMIQKKYPGSVKNFKKGYKELLKKDFFGIKKKDLSKLNVIDKINIFYKTGIDVKFTKEEKELSDKVGACKTPEDVLKLAVEIAGYHKQKEEEKQQSQKIAIGKKDKDSEGEDKESGSSTQEQDTSEQDTSEKDDSSSDDTDTEDTTTQDTKDNQDAKQSDDEGDKEDKTAAHAATGSEGKSNDLKSATDQASGESINDVMIDSEAKENLYIDLPSKIDMKKLIVDHKTVYNDLKTTYWNQKLDSYEQAYKDNLDKKIITLYNDNKKVIQYMVKEFEMKKSADQYKRATVSKTGTLDMDKIHTYKFNDDLFAKMTTIPGATNHGMIMLLDWSGSMAYNMEDTLKQLYNLIWFCQRVKIPYQVLAFSDVFGDRFKSRWDAIDKSDMVQKFVHNEYNLKNLKLIEFFTSEQTKQESMDMMKYLLGYAGYWNSRSWYNRDHSMSPMHINDTYNLGGTPLDHALMTVPFLQKAFVEKHKIQKFNLVLLTDGDSHSVSDKFELQSDGTWKEDGDTWTDGFTTITHKESGKSIKSQDRFSSRTTTSLLQLLKKIIPNMSITGFFIAGSGRAGRVNLRTIESKFKLNHHREKDKSQIVAIQKQLRTNRVAICKTQGYDEYYILPTGGRDIESEELTIKEGAKTSSIKSAFAKSLKAKTVNRQLLNKFIGMVA